LITINVIRYYYFIIRPVTADDVYCTTARGGIAFNWAADNYYTAASAAVQQ